MNDKELKKGEEQIPLTPAQTPEQRIWGGDELDRVLADSDANVQKQGNKHEPQQRYRQSRAARRGFPYFWAIYASLLVIAVIAIFCVCGYVNTLLAEYELVQPKYKADQVFAEHFENPDIEALMNFTDDDFAEFESKDTVVAYIKEQLKSAEITYAETMKNADGERIYTVYSGNRRFAYFTLKEGNESTKHGFKYYELGEMKMQFELSSGNYVFVLPDRYTLYVNGISVSDKYKTGETHPTDAYKISGGKCGVNYTEYLIEGLTTAPTENTFSVKDETGETAPLYWDEDRGVYTVDMVPLTVRIPGGYLLYLEGGAVSESFISTDKEPAPSAYNKFLAEDAEGIDYVEYTIGGIYSGEQPNITVKSADGYEGRVYYVEKEAVYESSPAYNTALMEEYSESIKEFFRQYTLYLQYVNVTADGEPTDYIKKSDLRPYFDTSSQTWKSFNSISPSWNFEPTRYEFIGESVDEFITYPDGTFSCRVKQTYNSWRKNATYSQDIDKTVFYKISGGKILIYEMTNTKAVQGIGQPVVEG